MYLLATYTCAPIKATFGNLGGNHMSGMNEIGFDGSRIHIKRYRREVFDRLNRRFPVRVMCTYSIVRW